MLLLDDNIAKNHTLSIRLAPDGFSFFVLDQTENKVVYFQHSPLSSHQDVVLHALSVLHAHDLFTYSFAEVRILVDNAEVTVVPSEYYDVEQKDATFALNYDVSPADSVMSNHSTRYDVDILFAVQQDLVDFFNKHFANVRFIHQLTLMMNQATHYPNKAQEQLFISYTEDHFSAVALRNNRLVYHNVFKLNVPDDLIYYFLLIIQELGFDQYASNAVLDGVIEQGVTELIVIKQYLAQLDFMPLVPSLSYPEVVLETPSYYHSSLFALPFCE